MKSREQPDTLDLERVIALRDEPGYQLVLARLRLTRESTARELESASDLHAIGKLQGTIAGIDLALDITQRLEREIREKLKRR